MIKPFANVLEPDERFSHLGFHDEQRGLVRELRMEDLYNDVCHFELNAGVPLAVRQQFDAARYAYVYGWFAYDLATLAEHQCYAVLEMALRAKCEAKTVRAGNSLASLLADAARRKWLTSDDFIVGRKSYRDALSKMRNRLAHGKPHLDPQHTLDIMRLCARLLNKLFH